MSDRNIDLNKIIIEVAKLLEVIKEKNKAATNRRESNRPNHFHIRHFRQVSHPYMGDLIRNHRREFFKFTSEIRKYNTVSEAQPEVTRENISKDPKKFDYKETKDDDQFIDKVQDAADDLVEKFNKISL
ncbi:uncharacterized protein OCT59_001338 [Rhizophagus irregularis]|uniref:Uncharacterized protein n=1 Tax=Rhizophagus irregularis (strain DAOM 181602 / DAOM 197198 / MUCL 43194) TaxID=747089 RepID=U9TVR4_RHIID|nr:hypothetical protein GLOIN_2v1771294 [Rhizophagus irregularis DAOM 181602=DAOM 197198]POG74460.1 hypothetical protein GLOIN_2v1771294 [Rhizophagus irregularis DAOM 181602=DAOM 197198]UZO00084.1 hypothetical protein OCT59_001338 [Rhizophagus irregularis]GBC29707.1 hypothetical protein GLOIN_2v1771294 [Rhizophagus irregularis DAOM 181602=DAOM 197198]|eukprot:XP_025181326.1 hypothetical protein GLOIN_2v1771294 [Rhizophagus irregularis DAOM 181602=DAOM 197198]